MIKKVYINENDNTDFGKVPEDFRNEKLDDIDFVMYKYVQDSRFGINIVADDQDGNYRVSYEGEVVDVSFDTDSNMANYVYTINDEGPYEHNSYEFISSDIMEFIDCMYDLEESYNNNTEEQELAEFLDWLKQEKIRVTDVNKKFKMIHIQNPDDLDMASWYLHDRDYFKKLSDFGWMVSAPSPAGRKVAKALKMESKQLNEDEIQEFPNEVTVQINKYSDRSGTYVKSRIIPNVVRIEDTDNYFYICTSDDYCYEYAKDSLYDGSYRYTVLD